MISVEDAMADFFTDVVHHLIPREVRQQIYREIMDEILIWRLERSRWAPPIA